VVGLIERFYDSLGGAVLLDGVDVRQYNLKALRGLVRRVVRYCLSYVTACRAATRLPRGQQRALRCGRARGSTPWRPGLIARPASRLPPPKHAVWAAPHSALGKKSFVPFVSVDTFPESFPVS
jgi:hypothetical protein